MHYSVLFKFLHYFSSMFYARDFRFIWVRTRRVFVRTSGSTTRCLNCTFTTSTRPPSTRSRSLLTTSSARDHHPVNSSSVSDQHGMLVASLQSNVTSCSRDGLAWSVPSVYLSVRLFVGALKGKLIELLVSNSVEIVGMELVVKLHFHAPRLIRRFAAWAVGSAELRPTTRLMAD